MRIGEISWRKFEQKAPSIALLPTGSTEQHGPHGPMATDIIIAESIAVRAAEITETISLPPINIGVSQEHASFPGTLYLSPEVFRTQLRETILSAYETGIEKFVVVNGHGGNVSSIKEVCKYLYLDHDVKAIEWTWFNTISSGPMGHAGEMETSLIMYLQEELIDGENVESGARSWGQNFHRTRIAYDTREFTENGVVGDPTKATRERGKELFDESTEQLVSLIEDFRN